MERYESAEGLYSDRNNVIDRLHNASDPVMCGEYETTTMAGTTEHFAVELDSHKKVKPVKHVAPIAPLPVAINGNKRRPIRRDDDDDDYYNNDRSYRRRRHYYDYDMPFWSWDYWWGPNYVYNPPVYSYGNGNGNSYGNNIVADSILLDNQLKSYDKTEIVEQQYNTQIFFIVFLITILLLNALLLFFIMRK